MQGVILHAGCGNTPLPDVLNGLREVRLDIDPRCKPDIVANLTDLGDIGPFDVIYCSHCLEHFYPHEVPKVLSEFKRVLKPGGMCNIFVPDLEDVPPTEDILYESEAGPICGLDMYYGYRRYTDINPYMAHHTGFIQKTLEKVLKQAGFAYVTTHRTKTYDLLGVAMK